MVLERLLRSKNEVLLILIVIASMFTTPLLGIPIGIVVYFYALTLAMKLKNI